MRYKGLEKILPKFPELLYNSLTIQGDYTPPAELARRARFSANTEMRMADYTMNSWYNNFDSVGEKRHEHQAGTRDHRPALFLA